MLNIAVIIAHYNYNHFLKQCLQSCIDQTYSNYICVIDDGSKESPASIMEDMFGKPLEKDGKFYFSDKAVLIFTEGQTGPSNARNIGIKECLGFDAYMILDADDYMLPTKIEKMVKCIEDKNIGVVYADYYIENIEKGVTTMEFKHPYDLFLLEQNCIVHSGSLISARFLNAIKISEYEWYRNDLRVAEDYNLWLRLSKICIFHHIPEFLTVTRSHSQDSTHTVSATVWQRDLVKAKQ